MKCRSCNSELNHVFVDLINAPASNSYLTAAELDLPESYYPLKVYVCHHCFLVQIEEYKKSDEIFASDYAYFSSFSSSWLAHAREYVEMITARLKLDASSKVVEIASNDGYLLKNFVEKNIPCIGIEPTKNTAEAAAAHGVFSYNKFWSSDFAREFVLRHGEQDLILGNNVLAHTPYITDFIHGLAIALKDTGTITVEFPHLLNLIKFNQFDTIYHEHFSYLSLLNIEGIFHRFDLMVYDVEELPTHGGSLRVYAKKSGNSLQKISGNVEKMRAKESIFGLTDITTYTNFQTKVEKAKYDLLTFLLDCKAYNKKVIAYGAAAKGNTLLNYCGIKGSDLISNVVDASKYKQGKFLPGSHIHIAGQSIIAEEKPDIVLILPWNIKEEIASELSYIREWQGKFALAIPELRIF